MSLGFVLVCARLSTISFFSRASLLFYPIPSFWTHPSLLFHPIPSFWTHPSLLFQSIFHLTPHPSLPSFPTHSPLFPAFPDGNHSEDRGRGHVLCRGRVRRVRPLRPLGGTSRGQSAAWSVSVPFSISNSPLWSLAWIRIGTVSPIANEIRLVAAGAVECES